MLSKNKKTKLFTVIKENAERMHIMCFHYLRTQFMVDLETLYCIVSYDVSVNNKKKYIFMSHRGIPTRQILRKMLRTILHCARM